MKPPSYYIKKYEEFIVEHGEFSYVPIVDVLVGKSLFNAETVVDALYDFEKLFCDIEFTEELAKARNIIEEYEKVVHAYNNIELIDIYVHNMEVRNETVN